MRLENFKEDIEYGFVNEEGFVDEERVKDVLVSPVNLKLRGYERRLSKVTL